MRKRWCTLARPMPRLGTRVLGPLYGTGLQVWAAQLTVALSALALGYWIGGRVADRAPSPRLFLLAVVLAGVGTALVPVLAAPITELGAGLGLAGGALLAATLLFGPTPVSVGDECRLVSPANLLGHVDGDPEVLRGVPAGARIRIEAAG